MRPKSFRFKGLAAGLERAVTIKDAKASTATAAHDSGPGPGFGHLSNYLID